ncbi:MAG: LytR family transcriptional regulator [Ruminococcaceae bacterium]|nr:LytR family transcriptional regulator [Oscillospiraceae bacterium]
MERKSFWWIFRVVALSLQLIASVVASILLIQLNMLPGVYVALIILALVLLLEFSLLFMFIKVKNTVSLWRRIVSCVIAFVVVIGCGVISKFVWDTKRMLDQVADDVSGAPSTYVLVLNENPAQSLADTKGYRFGALENYDTELTQQLLAVIETEIGNSADVVYFKQTAEMVDALYNEDVDALIMSAAGMSLYIEEDDSQNLLARVRFLYTHTYRSEKEETPKTEDVNVTNTPFVFYISGSDTRSKKLTVSRSDVNILAVVNPVDKQILLINTPRDYFVANPAGKDALDKLTHCGNHGVENSVKALEKLYDTEITHYAKINFYGFKALIDAIDGITVVSDQAFTTFEGIYIKKGENNLNGEEALAFARDRYHISGGDDSRGKNQMRVIQAVVDKMTHSTTLISNYGEILKGLEGMFVTSLSTEEMGDLVKMQLSDMAAWDMQSFSVTGTGAMKETYSVPGQNLSVKIPDEDVVAYAQKLIQRVLDGEVLESADMAMPQAAE